MRSVLVVLGFTVSLFAFSSCSRGNRIDQGSASQLSSPGSSSLSVSLAQSLIRYGADGGVVVRGHCSNANFILDDVDVATVRQPRDLKDAMEAWQALSPRLTITNDANSMWHVVDTTASAQILSVRIPALTVNAFDLGSAVNEVFSTNEVEKFATEHSIRRASSTGGLMPVGPSKLPQLTMAFRDVTVESALYSVLRKYPGVWVYTECSLPNNDTLIDLRTFSPERPR